VSLTMQYGYLPSKNRLMSNQPTIRNYPDPRSAIAIDVENHLDELQRARDRCFNHFGPEFKDTSVVVILIIINIVVFLFSFPLLFGSMAISILALAWRRKREGLELEYADHYRRVFRVSSRLAVALESQNSTDMNSFTFDSLQKLERAAIAAANPESVHNHSRLAIAALGTLQKVGDEKTLNSVSRLLVPQRCSEEQRGVMDARLDCINGISGRIYGQSGNSKLLRPSANDLPKENDLLRAAANQPSSPQESLLRPTVGSTAGPE
jgi:hypothetical protein